MKKPHNQMIMRLFAVWTGPTDTFSYLPKS